MFSRTFHLPDDIDPFIIGGDSGFLWSRATPEDPLLAGLGEAARIPISRPTGAVEAQQILASIDNQYANTRPGMGPVAFAALPYDRYASGELIVPRVVLAAAADGERWMTITDDGSTKADDVLHELRWMTQNPKEPVQPTHYHVRSSVPPEVWRDEIVGQATEIIRGGALDKVVLSREMRISADQDFNLRQVLDRLRDRFPTAIVFAVDGFVGASPELLVSRHGEIVRAHPLAGTAARAADPVADARLATELFESTKNRWEHLITIDWLLDGLLPFCSFVDAEPEPSIVSLANVHHLGTLVEGRLAFPAASVLELVAALHPTPAVGGDPQDEALRLQSKIERANRGRYAGPVGWLDADGNGSFAVGIRSAQLMGNSAVFFAGNGIVADSDPAAELAETRQKLQTMLGALVVP